MSKIETTSKVSLKLRSRTNLGRWDARAEPSTLDTAHKLPHSLERAKEPSFKGIHPPYSRQLETFVKSCRKSSFFKVLTLDNFVPLYTVPLELWKYQNCLGYILPPQDVNMKHLRMCRPQILSAIHNFSTKFHVYKINSLH